MRHPLLLGLYGLSLLSCSDAVPSETTPVPAPVQHLEKELDAQEEASFEAVLRQHQALNARLDHVTYRLRAANAELCPQTERSLGLTVHTVEDYPEDIQALARATLSVSDVVSVRTVWPGSPADISGILPGDNIISLSGYELPTGPTAKTLYAAIAGQSLNATTIDLRITRNNEEMDINIRPETICGYDSRILWVEQVNAFTDGETLLITSELLRKTDNENDLAMFVAHEMAHAIAKHVEDTPSKTLELEADRMGLVLMARAGFDIDTAIANWPDRPHPHFSNPETNSTHPSEAQRLENFQATHLKIRAKLKVGEELTFDLSE